MAKIDSRLATAVLSSLPDLSEEEVAYLLAHPEQLAKLLAGLRTLPQPQWPNYLVEVDWDLRLAEAIRRGGYDWVYDQITEEHFPNPNQGRGKEKMRIALADFEKRISSEQAIAEIDRHKHNSTGLRPLLALGEQHPNLQRQFPIVALGQTWRFSSGGLSVPFLHGHGSYRDLSLAWWDGDWFSYWRFAAVRK